MAEVFRAELVGAEGVTRELVVKKILHTLSLDPEAVAMFIEEARLAARLHHPNVVHVYEFGRAGDSYFLAMELVDGCDLATLLRGERVPPAALAWVFSELLDGLAYVHSLRGSDGVPLGLVHRDISPHNVLVGAAGEVKLADFGIATVAERVAPDESVRGKFAYMAPEQAKGGDVDARADLFAVGAMLYESLAGRRMYAPSVGGRASEAVREGRVEPITAVNPEVAPSLAAVVMRAVSADRDARFADAASFRAALVAAFGEAGVAPDREALRAVLTRHLERAQAASALTTSDRTLTVDDSSTEAPESDDARSVTQSPEARSAEPPTAGSRRLIERVGIAIGVFTLAVLAERKTRPRPPGAAVVRVALPDDEGLRAWFDREPRAAAERACRCRVEVRTWRDLRELHGWMRAGEADLVALTTTVLPALIDAGVVGDRGAREGAGNELRPEVSRAFAEAALDDERRIVPAAVDLVVLAWRAEAVRDATARAPSQLGALDRALVDRVGAGLPAGYAFERDPRFWTWWDLLVAGWSWRASGAPSVALVGGVTTWMARAGACVSAPSSAVRSVSNHVECIVEPLGWQGLLSSLDALEPSDGSNTNRVPSAVVAPARALLGRGERWELSPVPRGHAWALDAGRSIESWGSGTRVGEVLGWSMSTRATEKPLARRAMSALVTPRALSSMADAWRALPIRVGSAEGDPTLRGGLAQEEAVLRGGPFSLATAGATLAEAMRASAALESLGVQARSTGAGAFVGGGRWRTATLREAVERALGVRLDGGL